MGVNWCRRCNGSGFVFRLNWWPFAKCPDCDGDMYAKPPPRSPYPMSSRAAPPRPIIRVVAQVWVGCGKCRERQPDHANFCRRCGSDLRTFLPLPPSNVSIIR